MADSIMAMFFISIGLEVNPSDLVANLGLMDKGVHAAVIGAALISMGSAVVHNRCGRKIYDSVDAHLPSPVKKLNAKIFSVCDRAFHVFGTLSKTTVYNLTKRWYSSNSAIDPGSRNRCFLLIRNGYGDLPAAEYKLHIFI